MMSHNRPGELALFRMDQLEYIDAKSLSDHEESLFPNWLCFALFLVSTACSLSLFRNLAVLHSQLTDLACPFRQRRVDKRSRLIAKDRADWFTILRIW